MQLNREAAGSPEAIETALRYATTRFGLTLTLQGSQDFQRRAVEIAVTKGLGVKFADAQLDAYREQLQAERRGAKRPPIQLTKEKEPKRESRHQLQHARQVPPAHLRDRLHHLSESDVVFKPEHSFRPLRQDVRRRVDERETRRGDSVQRAARCPGGSGSSDVMIDAVPNIPLSELMLPMIDVAPSSTAPADHAKPGLHVGRIVKIKEGYVTQSGGVGPTVTYRLSDFSDEGKALLRESLSNKMPVRIDVDKSGRPILVADRQRNAAGNALG